MDNNGSSRLLTERVTAESEGSDEKITSVDSGIETGNDSNDSVAPQLYTTFNWLQPQLGRKWALPDRPMIEPPFPMAKYKTIHLSERNQSPQGAEVSEAQPNTSEWSCDDINQPQSSLSADSRPDAVPIFFGLETSIDSRNIRLASFSSECLNYPSPLQLRRKTLPVNAKEKLTGYRRNFVVRRTRFPDRFMQYFLNPQKCRLRNSMHTAAATNNVEALASILATGVSPNTCDREGRTALHIASVRGYTEVVDLLLKNGADANVKDCIGNTPLHLAAVTNHIAVVTLLLQAGTDPLSPDCNGYSPLQLARAKLRLLQNCRDDDDINRVKSDVHNIVGMLAAFLQNRKGCSNEMEALSSVCSRLTLFNTSEQVKDQVQDLLTKIDYLKLNS